MKLLFCMSIAGTIPVVICLFLYIIQRDNYNYILARRLLLTGLFFIWYLCSWLSIWFRRKHIRKYFSMKKHSYIYPIHYLSGMKDQVNMYGFLSGSILLLLSGWQVLLHFLFMNLLNIWRKPVISEILFLKRLRILKIISPIIWYLMGSAARVRLDFFIRK